MSVVSSAVQITRKVFAFFIDFVTSLSVYDRSTLRAGSRHIHAIGICTSRRCNKHFERECVPSDRRRQHPDPAQCLGHHAGDRRVDDYRHCCFCLVVSRIEYARSLSRVIPNKPTSCCFHGFFAAHAVLQTATAGGPSGPELFKPVNIAIETACLLLSSFTCGMSAVACGVRNHHDVRHPVRGDRDRPRAHGRAHTP